MWFDANAALSELGEGRESDTRPLATTATSATPAQRVAPIVAEVASVATLPTRNREPAVFPHGAFGAEHPRTWTGRLVSLDEWQRLSEWERHGPNGQLWCGIARTWIDQKED